MKNVFQFILFSILAISCSEKQDFHSAFVNLPIGQIRAEGWMKLMVESEKDGVTGHLVGYAVPDRGSEYCTTVEWFITCIESARILGDMHYADIAERCYFNAAQGARLPVGKAIQYSSFPNQLYAIEQGTDEWNQFLMFNHSPKDSMFITHRSELRDVESPWDNPPVYITTKAQVSNDKWRLGMQWYTSENLQPPAPPSAILAYQIDQSLSKEIRLVPYGTTKLRIVYFPYSVNVIQ